MKIFNRKYHKAIKTIEKQIQIEKDELHKAHEAVKKTDDPVAIEILSNVMNARRISMVTLEDLLKKLK